MSQNKIECCLCFCLLSALSSVGSAETVVVGEMIYAATNVEVGAGQPAMVVCDFNADGHLDVLIANYADNNMIVFQGNGKGNLSEVGRYPVGENPTGLAVADVNGVGHVDVAIANHETSYVTFLYGNGKGDFKQTTESRLNLAIDPHPHEVQLKDLDGDNKVDLIVDNRTHLGLLVLKGQGDGTFLTPGKTINMGGDPYRGFAVNDINGDGNLDLLTPNQRDIGIAINNGSNDMSFALSQMAQSEAPFAVALADMTGDGALDLLVANNGSTITLIPGDGKGNFIESSQKEIKASSGAKQIATGDINGDGIKDALISNWSGEMLVVLGGNGSMETLRFQHSKLANPWAVALADLNEDGKSDFIIADGDSQSAVVFVSQ
ncbi:VCBS repeat-containing protein [Marinicella sp. S1101]|uniref:FG-GAP repeat domain-containing protein n=1 Tax=Marinicella marina TaxID=2996016 RepID=UPI002260D839|nr:VCBS repeat-containing protein [Marinicella marina]MCX7552596.1 VCBS repeat-containing protein [Marinicella marina]MDJ1139472.1 VCBS repeat-containing protein [Marinicella marina]